MDKGGRLYTVNHSRVRCWVVTVPAKSSDQSLRLKE